MEDRGYYLLCSGIIERAVDDYKKIREDVKNGN